MLGLIRVGACDDTSQQIKIALSFPNNPRDAETGIQKISSLLKKCKSFQFYIANKLYLSSKYSMRKDFVNVDAKYFDVSAENIDFTQHEVTVKEINEFVRNQTFEDMKDIVNKSSIESSSKMVTISAAACKFQWMKFQKDNISTRKPFHLTSFKKVDTDFLEKSGYYRYFECKTLKAKFLEMPIELNLFNLIIALPDDINGLNLLENNIKDVFCEQHFQEENVKISIPKFVVDFTTDLKSPLKHMGMKKAFSSEAEFDNVLAEKRSELRLSHVIHSTSITLCDDSTVAGNIKAVGATKRVSVTTKVFDADHPFIVYFKSNNTIVFAGRIKVPNQSK